MAQTIPGEQIWENEATSQNTRCTILKSWESEMRPRTSSTKAFSIVLDDFETITERNRTKSLLLRLPGETRNHIYIHLFSNDVFFPKRGSYKPVVENNKSLPELDWMRRRREWIYLLQVPSLCRDLHCEIGLAPYSMSLFHDCGQPGFRNWFGGLELRQKACIQRLHISRYRNAREPLYNCLESIYGLVGSTIKEVIVEFMWHREWKEHGGFEHVYARWYSRDWTISFKHDYGLGF